MGWYILDWCRWSNERIYERNAVAMIATKCAIEAKDIWRIWKIKNEKGLTLKAMIHCNHLFVFSFGTFFLFRCRRGEKKRWTIRLKWGVNQKMVVMKRIMWKGWEIKMRRKKFFLIEKKITISFLYFLFLSLLLLFLFVVFKGEKNKTNSCFCCCCCFWKNREKEEEEEEE